jgi:hypothetical protein
MVGGTHPIPVESMRLKRIRDGREDYEYLHALAEQGRGSDAMAVARDLFPSMRQTTVSPAAVSSMRDQAAAMIGGAAYVPRPQAQAPSPGDRTAPEAKIQAGPSGKTRDRTPTFRFTSSEPNSVFQCRRDSGAWRSCSSRHSLKRLRFGRHSFAVRARDAAGNWDPTPNRRSFRVVKRSVAGRAAHR